MLLKRKSNVFIHFQWKKEVFFYIGNVIISSINNGSILKGKKNMKMYKGLNPPIAEKEEKKVLCLTIHLLCII